MSNSPNIGNILDSIFKPEWLAIVHAGQALGANLAGQAAATVKADLQTAQSQLSTALASAATAASAAQSKVDATVNPIVNTAVHAAGVAIAAAYPPFSPLITAAEGEVETLADGGTDAILIALISKAASLLSTAGKSVAAVNLSNLAGAS